MLDKIPIIWSPLAEETYLNILKYISDKWSLNAARKFDRKTESLLIKISIHHRLCPGSKLTGLRKCVITPQTSLIYKITEYSIELVVFIDNRTNHIY